MYIPDVTTLPLNPRPAYIPMITAGAPTASGRIVHVSDDEHTARVVWSSTPGTFHFKPDPIVVDVGCVMQGEAIIRRAGHPDQHLRPGTLVEFPREPFDLQIIETFIKVSFLYNPDGLKVQAEPVAPVQEK